MEFLEDVFDSLHRDDLPCECTCDRGSQSLHGLIDSFEYRIPRCVVDLSHFMTEEVSAVRELLQSSLDRLVGADDDDNIGVTSPLSAQPLSDCVFRERDESCGVSAELFKPCTDASDEEKIVC